jgi:hypothetical protein
MKDVVFNTEDVWCPHCASKYMFHNEFVDHELPGMGKKTKVTLQCEHPRCGEKFDLEVVTTIRFRTSKH